MSLSLAFFVAGCIQNAAVGTGQIAKQNRISYSKNIQKFLKMVKRKNMREENVWIYGFVFGN